MAQQGRVAKAKLKDGLTPKQAKFVQKIAEGKTGTQAALESYNVKSVDVAKTVASENYSKPNIREAIQRALEHHQITPEMALEPVKRGLLFQGDTERESLDMNLKAVGIYSKLLGMTEDKSNQSNGNTFVFNNVNSSQNFYKK